MAAIKSETVDPLAAKATIEEPTKFPLDHRKSFVSRVDFRFSHDNAIEAKDLALSKTNFFWLRLNANKFYGQRNKALDRCVPRDLSLCLAQYDSITHFTSDGLRQTDSEPGRQNNTKNTNRFLRLGRYDPFEARGSYECLEAPEVQCSSITEELERTLSFPERLTTSEFKAALGRCLVASYVRDRWDGLNVDEAFEKFTKDHVEKLKGLEKDRNLCVGTPGRSAGVKSSSHHSSTDGLTLPKLPTRRLALCSPGKQSEWKVRYWDPGVLDRMIMSGKNK